MDSAVNESLTPYKLLLACPSGLSPSQVSVDFDEIYDRIPHPDPDLEESITKIWDQRIQKNSSLYNGKKFRYGGHMLHAGKDSNEIHICLHFGLTDYRTFVGTNLNPSWEKFLSSGEDDCRRCQHTSSLLGNGAIVETSDKHILVLRRSNNVGEFPGRFVFPGGHPEPQEVGIEYHESGKDFKDSDFINKKISEEMFDSIIREVVEEIGVPAESLSKPVFIGISCRKLNVRPTAFFSIKCSLESQEIQKFYLKAQDGFESTQLHTVVMADLETMSSKMRGCHHGGFELYKLMLPGFANGDMDCICPLKRLRRGELIYPEDLLDGSSLLCSQLYRTINCIYLVKKPEKSQHKRRTTTQSSIFARK